MNGMSMEPLELSNWEPKWFILKQGHHPCVPKNTIQPVQAQVSPTILQLPRCLKKHESPIWLAPVEANWMKEDNTAASVNGWSEKNTGSLAKGLAETSAILPAGPGGTRCLRLLTSATVEDIRSGLRDVIREASRKPASLRTMSFTSRVSGLATSSLWLKGSFKALPRSTSQLHLIHWWCQGGGKPHLPSTKARALHLLPEAPK